MSRSTIEEAGTVRGQKGEGRLGLIIWLAIFAAAIFAAARIIPAKTHVMDLHDYCDRELQNVVSSGRDFDQERFLQNVLAKAKEVNIPLEKNQLQLTVTSETVTLRMQHEVVVDLAVYKWVWPYDKTFVHRRF